MMYLLELLFPDLSTKAPGLWLAIAVACAVCYVLYVIGLWKVFVKAGIAGWKSLIPIYNVYLQFTICWSPKAFINVVLYMIIGSIAEYYLAQQPEGVLAVMLTISVIGCLLYRIFLQVTLYQKLSAVFGHGVAFGLGLYFLEVIFIIILGFGKSQYQKPAFTPEITPLQR